MEKQDIIKIYFYLDKNKVKILTTEYDLSDFNRKFSGNIEVFNNLIQNKVKGYDKVEIYINRRGRKLWISNDFFIDTIITCRSLEKLVETVVYDVADPDKTDEDVFNDNKNESFQQFLEDNIPKTCGLINVYCDITMPLDTILDVVSYAHRIGASVSVFTYDCFRLKEFNDWAKVNKYIMYKTHIVF